VGGSEGSGPTSAPAYGRFYTYVLNNIDVVTESPLFKARNMYCLKFSLEIASFHSYRMVQGIYIWDFKYSDR